MFDLPEKITIWNATGSDGFENGWTVPITADARIAMKREKVTNENGDNVMSKAVVYCEELTLIVDSKVVFGETDVLEPPSTANDVILIAQTPSGAGSLKKVWL